MKMPRAETESAVALNELISFPRGDVLDVGSTVFCAEKKTKKNLIVKNQTDWISDAENLIRFCRSTL